MKITKENMENENILQLAVKTLKERYNLDNFSDISFNLDINLPENVEFKDNNILNALFTLELTLVSN